MLTLLERSSPDLSTVFNLQAYHVLVLCVLLLILSILSLKRSIEGIQYGTLKSGTRQSTDEARCRHVHGVLDFSSPEPKAHGELIVYQSSRRLSVWLCVNIFKLEYLRNQWANRNEILSEPSLGVRERLR